VDARVDGTLAEIEADDPVIAGDGFGGETFEHARGDPFVAAIPQRRIRHSVAQEALDIDPGAAGHEPDQDAFEADPVRDPRSMTPTDAHRLLGPAAAAPPPPTPHLPFQVRARA